MNPWKNGILSATPPPETDSPISRARASPFLGETSWLAGRAPAADPKTQKASKWKLSASLTSFAQVSIGK